MNLYNLDSVLIAFIIFFAIIFSIINMIPVLVSHTGWKYILFLWNLLLGWTIIGWLIALIIAISTNNSAKREQELMYLIRKISDKD